MSFDWSKESKEKVFEKAQIIIDKFNEENRSKIELDKTRFSVYKKQIARVYIKPLVVQGNTRLIDRLCKQNWFLQKEMPRKAFGYAFKTNRYNMLGVIQIEIVEGALLRLNGRDSAERGIEFDESMVKALFEGNKKIFRRIAKSDKLPYAQGEVLYIKESWSEDEKGNLITKQDTRDREKYKWKQNRKMPIGAAQRYIRVIKIKKENLRDIDEVGSRLEGYVADEIPAGKNDDAEWLSEKYKSARMKFKEHWDKGISKERRKVTGWYGNPEVWVIEFEEI